MDKRNWHGYGEVELLSGTRRLVVMNFKMRLVRRAVCLPPAPCLATGVGLVELG